MSLTSLSEASVVGSRRLLSGCYPVAIKRTSGRRFRGTLNSEMAPVRNGSTRIWLRGHPLIQCLLCGLQVVEHLPGVELHPEGAVKALDLPRRGRRARLGEDVVDPVLPANPVEEHFHWWLSKAPGEDLAVVGQDLGWKPYALRAELNPSQTV